MSLYSDIIRSSQTAFTNKLSQYTIYFDDNIPETPDDKFINIKFQLLNDLEQKTMLESNDEATFQQPLLISFECKQSIGTASSWRYDVIFDIQEILNNRTIFQSELTLVRQKTIFEAKSSTNKSDIYNLAVLEALFYIRSRRIITL